MKNRLSRSRLLICLALTAMIFMGMDCQKKQVINVIGGYAWMAKFMEQKGYVATDGVYGVNTQYNFENTLLNQDAAWVPYEADNPDNKPFDCGVCHTTGYTAEGQPAAVDYAGSETCKACHNTTNPDILSSFPQTGHQHALTSVNGEAPEMPFTEIPGAPEKFKIGTTADFDFAKLPGIDGQWVEPNIGCEACHGPSKAHANASTDLAKRPDLAVARQACAKCHVSGTIENGVVMADGAIETDGNLVKLGQEWEEWLASPHSRLDNATDNATYPGCATCHNPHASTVFGNKPEANGDGRKVHTDADCLQCHAGKTVDITEMADAGVMCIDCHMPYTVLAASGYPYIGAEGNYAYAGDLRSHQFKIRIDKSKNSYIDVTTKNVRLDAQGKTPGITLDLVCQACHSDGGLRLRDLPIPKKLYLTQLQASAPDVHK
jgi:hypothetical protein